MELKKIKENGNMIEIELRGGSIGFANLIKEELWNDKNVEEAAYIKEHQGRRANDTHTYLYGLQMLRAHQTGASKQNGVSAVAYDADN